MNDFELLKEAYLNGLEPQFKNIAYSMFDEGKPFEDIYRYISKLRHPDRGTIEVTRPLIPEERKFLSSLSSDLRKKSFLALMQGIDFQIVKSEVQQQQNMQKVRTLKKEAIEHAIKAVVEMQKNNIDIPLAYFELIFDWDVLIPMDYDLFGKMSLLMLSTYDEQARGKNYQDVRSFMFKKIEECFERGIIPHPHIFDFMFKGNWISEKTFMILHIHAQELIEAGMSGKLILPLKRMLEIRRNENNSLHPFSLREEHYFISLINLFQK